MLSPDELDCIRHLMGKIGCADAVIEAGPMRLIEDWRAFVMRCEKGFACDRTDFLQDLSVRTILARLVARLPRPLQLKFEPELSEADFRYRAIPKRDREFVMDPRLSSRHPPERDFWLYGLPAGVRLQ